MAIDPLNLSGTASMTFADDFNSLNLRVNGSGVWNTNYHWGAANGVTLTNNGEQEWYIDASYGPTQSVKPWSVSNGVLDLTAENASPEIQGLINGYKYTSGMLTTHDSFAQTYGYFEMRAELPQGNGLWPAFWLLPQDGSWPPEIDVMEQLGNDPNKYYTTAHSNASGQHTSAGSGIDAPDLTAGYHNYGVDWEADKLTYYLDGKQVFQTDTPADMHKPMYMLVNLAVGGYWPGDPTPDPNYHETMHVDYVHAYAAKPAGEITAADPSPPAPPAAVPDTSHDVAASPAPQTPVDATPAPEQASAPVDVPAAPHDTQADATPQPSVPVVEASAPDSAAPAPEQPAQDQHATTPDQPAEQHSTEPSAPSSSAPVEAVIPAHAETAPEAPATLPQTLAPVGQAAPETQAPETLAHQDATPVAEAAPAPVAAPADSFDFSGLTSGSSAPVAPQPAAIDVAALQNAVDTASTPARGGGHCHGSAAHEVAQDFQAPVHDHGHHHHHHHAHGHHWGF